MIDTTANTFCTAPWFQCRNTNQLQYRACCVIDHELSEFTGKKNYSYPETSVVQWMNSDYMHYLRENLSNGVKLKECSSCWNRENYAIESERQGVNKRVSELNGMKPEIVKNYFNNKKDYSFDLLLVADIKLSNICNFSCLMCDPEDSSQIYTTWYKNQSVWFVKEKTLKNSRYFDSIQSAFVDRNNLNLLESLLTLKPKTLKILGGEPLLDNKSFDLISTVSLAQQQNTAIQIITNGSKDLSLTKEKLINYKNVTYTISLEGINEVQDFIRKGSNWHEIEQNINNFIKNYGSQDLSIHTTIQALNLFHFDKLLLWAQNKNIRHSFLLLSDPFYLSLEAIPQELLEQSIKKLSTFNTKEVINLVSVLKQVIHDPARTEKLKQFVNWNDKNNTWHTVLPEWAQYQGKLSS